MFWIFAMLSGCAVKSTVEFSKAKSAYNQAVLEEVDSETYAWAMADSYMKKAWEEYLDSDYEDAEILAKEATKWISVAQNKTQGE
jgi:hypothetical protein